VRAWLRQWRRRPQTLLRLLHLPGTLAPLLAASLLLASTANGEVPCPGPHRNAVLEFTEVTGPANPLAGMPIDNREFGDIDGDGDFDLFLGADFYRNTGSRTQAAFELQSPPAHPLHTWGRPLPHFVDIDADGDLDAFTTADSNVGFYENIGSATTPQMDLRSGEANPLHAIDTLDLDVLVFADMDADGDFDVFAGQVRYLDNHRYFENIGTPEIPNYVLRSAEQDPLRDFSDPLFIDIDSDGDLDLLQYSVYSWVSYPDMDGHSLAYNTVALNTGTARIPEFSDSVLLTTYAAESFQEDYIERVHGNIVDLNGDGHPDLCADGHLYLSEPVCKDTRDLPELLCADLTLPLQADGTHPLLFRAVIDAYLANGRLALLESRNGGWLSTQSCGNLGDRPAVIYQVRTLDWRSLFVYCDITLHVIDNLPPCIFLQGDAEMTLATGQPYTEPGAYALENCGSVEVQIGGDTVDTSTDGLYVVRYDATDAQGNPAAQLARRVTVTSGARAAVTAPFVEDEAPVTWYDLDLIADFHLLDMNHDRRISLEEIAAFVDGGSESIPPEDYYHLNSDGDIGLTLPELHNWSDPLSPEPGYGNITSDTDGDYVLSFPELLRMIQLYNAGGYTCAEVPGATEDSFLPRPPSVQTRSA
jgi:hypothetical protein